MGFDDATALFERRLGAEPGNGEGQRDRGPGRRPGGDATWRRPRRTERGMFRRGRGRPRPIGRLHGRSAELDAVDAEQAADGTRRGGDELVEPGVPIGTALPRAASRPVIRSCRGRRDSMAGGRLVSVGGRSRARTGSGAAVTGVIALDLGARDMSRLGRGILPEPAPTKEANDDGPDRGSLRATTNGAGHRTSGAVGMGDDGQAISIGNEGSNVVTTGAELDERHGHGESLDFGLARRRADDATVEPGTPPVPDLVRSLVGNGSRIRSGNVTLPNAGRFADKNSTASPGAGREAVPVPERRAAGTP